MGWPGCRDMSSIDPPTAPAAAASRTVSRIVSKAILKIGADRQAGGGRDHGHVLERLATVHRVVRLPGGESIAGAGGGQRFKAQVRQQPGRTGIPRIGNDERTRTRMERAKGPSLFSLRQHGDHAGPAGVEGRPNVPSTTSTKFLFSRRIRRLLCAMVKFSRASGSDRKRAR